MENRTFPSPSAGSATLAPEPVRPAPHAPSRALRARRRRPAVLAMAVALISAGGLGGAVLYNSTGQRIAVLALARDVPTGQAITAGDLVVARIAGDPALHPLDARDSGRAIGLRATTDLHRGSLLVNSDLSAAPLVGPGQLTVGLAAKGSQLPATRLAAGIRVVIVSTQDSSGATGGTTRTPETMTATVVTVGRSGSDGGAVVDVAVDASDGARLAGWVAAGRFQVLLAPRGAAGGAPAPAAAPSASASAGGGA
ncbi:SAF domain-containing protein [Kitasatospora sp. NPDC002227]|uniref:SAF domain-containing protein n=1 Tax=Kitasatospora sp. NPDC002227 TaxID=3154773 RepID=UPI00332C9772